MAKLDFPVIADARGNILVWSCEVCTWLTNDADGEHGEYLPICEHPTSQGRSNLRSFPFKTSQDCCSPDIWCMWLSKSIDCEKDFHRWFRPYIEELLLGFRWANPHHKWRGLYHPDWVIEDRPECYSFKSLPPALNCGECPESYWCARNPWREHR